MFNPNDEGPISPMKKLKILSEKPQNVSAKPIESPLSIIKEHSTIDKQESNIEPLLQESSNQYVIFPISHDDMWHMYKELVGNFWTVTESYQDLEYLSLTIDEKQYMRFFSSIFASPNSQGLVIDNLAEKLCQIIQVTEAKFFYGHQLMVQDIHYEMYNQLLDKFASNVAEKEKLFKIVENFDAVVNKRKWVEQWKNSSFDEQLVASVCLHGLLFTSLEVTCEWLKVRIRNSVGHELVNTIEKMIYDLELQRDFSCLMISHLRTKPSKEKIIETIHQAAKIEFDFLINGVKIDLIGFEVEEVLQIIDKKTKIIKHKLFSSFEQKKKIGPAESSKMNQENREESTKENYNNHQKLCFDEDF